MDNFTLNYKIAEEIYVKSTAAFEEEQPKAPVNSTDDTPKIIYESIPDEINSEDSFDEIPDFDQMKIDLSAVINHLQKNKQ